MNIELSQASDLEVTQQLLAAVLEATKRGLLRRSHVEPAATMASAALRLAALKTAGLPTERPDAKNAGGAQ